MEVLHAKQLGVWSRLFIFGALLASAGCGHQQEKSAAYNPSNTPGPANEVVTLQDQMQQTERSSMPPQIKQQVEANLNAQIQAKKQALHGQ